MCIRKIVTVGVSLLGLGLGLGACKMPDLPQLGAAHGGKPTQEEIDACVQRGITYFKEKESYPTLRAEGYEGQRADDVAAARCAESARAF